MNSLKKILALTALTLSFGTSARAEFKLPPIQSLSLDNGMKIFFVPQNEVPLVHITLAIATGSASDGALWGLTSVTADALSLGTKSYSKQKIEDTFDFYGIDYQTVTNKDYTTIEASVATADLPKLLPIVAELVIAPKFPSAEVDKLRNRTVSQLKKGKESPNRIASKVFERLYYKDHPYASTEDGVAATVQKLKAADLVNFHAAHFQPQIAALTIAGDFDAGQVKTLIEQNFGAWKKGAAVPTQVTAPVKPLAATEVLLLDKSDSHETTFRIGGIGAPGFNKDWVKLTVINTLLGGRFTSILNEELRVKSGYTYGAKSMFNNFHSSGTFFISTFTATETTYKTLDLALATYKKFVENGIDQKTLDSAKAYVKGQFPPQYETLATLSDLTTELWAYGISIDQFNSFESQVDALTLDEANALIKSKFPRDKLEILMIGKASVLGAEAKKYGTLRIVPIDKVDTALPL
ncbi:MAG: insulinase family protein [Chitinophagaceae bacterium]|nr:insulinase family protein [Oligoflexus sp.]